MDPDDEFASCCRCGATKQVNWSFVFAEWLCVSCLWHRSKNLLFETVTVLPVRELTEPPGWKAAAHP